MRRHENGLMIPDVLSGPSAYLIRAQTLPDQIALAKALRVAVQAGGHIGIVPAHLALRFEKVYTFEPERENYDCLCINLDDQKNIDHRWGFLGKDNLPKRLAKHSKSSGGHQVGLGSGNVPCFRIDDLRLRHLDAIFLDVEGYEMNVIAGAMESIRKFKPLIVAEENKKAQGFGYRPGAIEKKLAPFGYVKTRTDGEDIVLEVA